MTPELVLLIVRVLAAVALYAFFGFAMWSLLQDLRAGRLRAETPPEAHLEILEGPIPPSRLGLEPTTEIGRAAGNAIQLDDATVSAHHARLAHSGGQWWLEDFASRNGTFVNELAVQEPLVVTYGDEIRFGRVRTRLARGAASSVPESTVPQPRQPEEDQSGAEM